MRSTRLENSKPWVQLGKGVVTAVVMLAFAGGALTAFGNDFQFHPILAAVPVDAAPTHAVATLKPANQNGLSTPQEAVEILNDWKYTCMIAGLGGKNQPNNDNLSISSSGSGVNVCITVSVNITLTVSVPGVSGGSTSTTITETVSVTVCV